MTRDVSACPQASSTEQVQADSVALIRNWPLTLFSGLLLPLLLSLGVWQLQRAEEKFAIQADLDARLSAQPRPLAGGAAETLNLQSYTPVRLAGHYTGDYYLLDNRTRDGRVGYEVLQVFESAGQRWLVNRGWIAAPSRRDRLPAVTWPRGEQHVIGFLYPVTEADATAATTAETIRPASGSRIQRIDSAFTGSLNLAQPRWTLRLSADSDTALVTGWQLLNSPPERHQGYAVQWFSMAAALVLLWLWAATGLPRLLRRKQVS